VTGFSGVLKAGVGQLDFYGTNVDKLIERLQRLGLFAEAALLKLGGIALRTNGSTLSSVQFGGIGTRTSATPSAFRSNIRANLRAPDAAFAYCRRTASNSPRCSRVFTCGSGCRSTSPTFLKGRRTGNASAGLGGCQIGCQRPADAVRIEREVKIS